MLPVVTATEFIKVMKSGRTAPILCGCADKDGKSAGEFVVKLRQCIGGTRGLLQEFLGSRLASHFGILVPEAVAVNIDLEFAEALGEQDRNLAASVKASIGLNFGSTMINPATTWLVERAIPDAMWRDAVNIFAFDALIQNPDRISANPNLFTQGDNIYVYDHETSFSFLLAVVKSAEPWNLEGEEYYLTRHVFYRRLKSQEIDLGDFEARLKALTADAIREIRDEIPGEWVHADLGQIEAHLTAVRDHVEQFSEQVRRRLA